MIRLQPINLERKARAVDADGKEADGNRVSRKVRQQATTRRDVLFLSDSTTARRLLIAPSFRTSALQSPADRRATRQAIRCGAAVARETGRRCRVAVVRSPRLQRTCRRSSQTAAMCNPCSVGWPSRMFTSESPVHRRRAFRRGGGRAPRRQRTGAPPACSSPLLSPRPRPALAPFRASSLTSDDMRFVSYKLSVGVTSHAYLLEIEGLLTQGSRHGRTLGERSVGNFEMDSSDWSIGIRYLPLPYKFSIPDPTLTFISSQPQPPNF